MAGDEFEPFRKLPLTREQERDTRIPCTPVSAWRALGHASIQLQAERHAPSKVPEVERE